MSRWRTALVTGASSGIGEAFARRLAADGTDLVVVARDVARLDALAAELREAHGVRVEVLGADLAAPVSRAAVEKRLGDPDRHVDLLVNNAGFGTNGRFVDLPVAREEQQVGLNVVAVLRLTSVALRGMVARGHGNIVNVASIAAFVPAPESATYAATKAFVCSFTDSLHDELAGTGVCATASIPGFTRTEFQARADWAEQDNVPERAWLSPEQVADETLVAAAAGRARVVPGLGYKALVGTAEVIPGAPKRWLASRIRRLAR